MKLKKNPGFIVALLMMIFISIIYGKVLLSPNSYLFNSSGDGIKNYYTYAYFIKCNSFSNQFEGMNYPYGEHVLFTDNHPILSLTLKSISKLFPFITDYSIGILNFILLCSILITSITLFKVFEKLNIQRSLSVLAAISITILAPQIFRLTGHYSLSYSFCIPLTILLILHFFERDKKWRTLIGLMLNGTFWLLIHPYLGLMSLLLPAMSIGAWVITNSMNRKFNPPKTE
jgi:hypothetical protein